MEDSVIRKAVEGDLKAFRMIFDHFLPRMRPVSIRYSTDEAEADDILQDAFIKIYYNLKTFKFEGSFEGWIRKTVVNTALNYHKKNKRTVQILKLDDVTELDVPEIELSDIENLEQDQLLRILKELPEGYRKVFSLYVLDDFSHKEIGAMLGIDEGTSRSQYSKAKKMINKLLLRQRTEEKSSLLNRIPLK